MKFIKLDDLKKSSVYITPNFPVIETRRYKFSFFQILTFFGIYSAIVLVAVIVLLALTPVKDIIYFFENEKLDVQAKRITELEGKIVFLTRELETIASTNKKLKYALILAGTDSIDSSSAIYDSLRQHEDNIPFGGNILVPFNILFGKIKQQDTSATSLIFIRPTQGFIIKSFDPQKGHMGIDFAVKEGAPVYSTAGGIIIFANYTAEDGKMVIIQHDKNYISVYKHCSAITKKERDVVVQGEMIALSGNTGYNTTGPHLHFEIWDRGRAIDPKKVLSNL